VNSQEAASQIGVALEQMTLALAGGDVVVAAQMAGQLNTACAAAEAARVRLEPAQREAIAHLLRRCGEAAERRGETLRALLLQNGHSRRAADTYRSG
jgi:hypothetical protein